MLTPETTYMVLLIVQALHLLHHRIAKRHISLAEVTAGLMLCVPSDAPLPGVVLMAAHLVLVSIQVIGSLWIKQLSPDWTRGRNLLATLG